MTTELVLTALIPCNMSVKELHMVVTSPIAGVAVPSPSVQVPLQKKANCVRTLELFTYEPRMPRKPSGHITQVAVPRVLGVPSVMSRLSLQRTAEMARTPVLPERICSPSTRVPGGQASS